MLACSRAPNGASVMTCGLAFSFGLQFVHYVTESLIVVHGGNTIINL